MAYGFTREYPWGYARNQSERNEERYEFSATIKHETKDAFLLDVGEEEPMWLPKSQCKQESPNEFSLPVWLAEKKGLV